jgi:GNAT superfamily N-acetyltransferase
MVQLRRMLRRSIDQGLPLAVLEVDGEIVAASRMESRGCRYARWTDLVVHPDHRGRGYHAALAARVADAQRTSGLGMVGEAAPMMDVNRSVRTFTAPEYKIDWSRRFEVLQLRPERRFPGQGRLRRALYSLGGRRRLRPQAEA